MEISSIAVIAFIAILFVIFAPAKKNNESEAKTRSAQRRRLSNNHSGDFQKTVMVGR